MNFLALMQYKFALCPRLRRDLRVNVLDLLVIDLHAAALDQPPRFALGFRCICRHEQVRNRRRIRRNVRLRHIFRIAAERRLRFRPRIVGFLFPVHHFGQLVRKRFLCRVDPLVLMRTQLRDLFERQECEKFETLFHIRVVRVAPVLVNS